METTSTTYRKYMFKYGILTIIYVLEKMVDREEYEECQKIMEAIAEQEKRLSVELPRNASRESIDKLIEVYQQYGVSGSHVVENSKYYSGIVLNELDI